MTENGQRRDMHPAEQIAGFRAMAQEGKTPAQIGDLLGYSPRHVQRMLKLADLAPVILDALAEDRITTEHCQALALENDTPGLLLLRFVSCEDSDLRLAGSDSYLAEVFPRYQCRHYDG